MTGLWIIGGFLGSGKTTSLLNIAKKLISEGKKVGLVTNDKGSQLVDTEYLQKNGLDVMDIKGGCFCCRLSELTTTLARLNKQAQPDIILAEPVGSNVDLIASVLKPVAKDMSRDYALSPLVVMADPKRLMSCLRRKKTTPTNMDYLFEKQMEEADIIFLNKSDLITPEKLEELLSYLKDTYKNAMVMHGSALTSSGMDELVAAMAGNRFVDKPSLDIDYDIYADAEAELGWCNAMFMAENLDAKGLANHIVEGIIKAADGEDIAHAKILATAENGHFKMSLTIATDSPTIAGDSQLLSPVRMVVNVRAVMPPQLIIDTINNSANDYAAKNNGSITGFDGDGYRPGRPKPEQRIV